MLYNALRQARTMLFQPTSHALVLRAALGSAYLGSYPQSIAAWYRTAANAGTLANGLAKIRAAREYDRASIYALSPGWKENFFAYLDGIRHHGGL